MSGSRVDIPTTRRNEIRSARSCWSPSYRSALVLDRFSSDTAGTPPVAGGRSSMRSSSLSAEEVWRSRWGKVIVYLECHGFANGASGFPRHAFLLACRRPPQRVHVHSEDRVATVDDHDLSRHER